MITVDTIRERLAADKKKTSRLATWEEIEYLLNYIDEMERITDAEIDRLRNERTQTRVEALLNAEQIALHSPMSRQERACRKATRDAYALVLDMMSEET